MVYGAKGSIAVTKIFSTNSNTKTHKLTDMFDKKSDKRIWVQIFSVWDLEKLFRHCFGIRLNILRTLFV